MSLGGRLLNVFATPGDVFEEVKAAPEATANWLVPALILVAVSWAAALLIFSQPAIKQQLSELTEQAIQRQIDTGHLSEQQAEQARVAGEKWAIIAAQIFAALIPVFQGFVAPFLWGLIVWLLGAQFFKGHFPYMKAVEVVGLANMISVLEVIVKTLLIVGLGNLYASPEPGAAGEGVRSAEPGPFAAGGCECDDLLAAGGARHRPGPAQRRVVRQSRGVGLWHLGGVHRLFHWPGGPGAGGVQADRPDEAA